MEYYQSRARKEALVFAALGTITIQIRAAPVRNRSRSVPRKRSPTVAALIVRNSVDPETPQ